MLDVIHDPLDNLLNLLARFSYAAQNDRSLAQLLLSEMLVREGEIGSVEKVSLGVFVDAEFDALLFFRKQ